MKRGNWPPTGGAVVYELKPPRPDAELERRLAEADALANACDGLATDRPELSARWGLSPGQRAGAWALLGAGAVFLVRSPEDFAAIGMLFASGLFALIVLMRVVSSIDAGISLARAARDEAAPERVADRDLPVITYLIPIYREANMAAHIVQSLGVLDYPVARLDIKLLVEADDTDTVAAMRALDLPDHIEILPVPRSMPRTKPKALNYGLAFTRGDIVAVLDAEDMPAAAQPRAAAAMLAQSPASVAVVQAPLTIYNRDRAWIARQSEMEYAIHFQAWLPLMQRMKWPVLLGGTSNYFRRSALVAAGGWDPYNVTEDADLGLRLARMGMSARMIAPPTREEAPLRIGHWVNQRTRWIKGHMQTWLVLMRNPVRVVQELGVWGFIGAQVSLGGSLLAMALHGPLLVWTLLAAASLAPIGVWPMVLFGTGYASVALAAMATGGLQGRWVALLTLPFYWPLLSLALMRAAWELKTSPHYWAKTPHGLPKR